MKYFKRFRPSGEPFYVDESGNFVTEKVASTNLVESSRSTHVAEFCEQTMFAESTKLEKPRRRSTDRSAARGRMEEAFRRVTAVAAGQQEASRQQAVSAMEEALARFSPNAARA